MKNRKLKNYLKLGILFFGISALLWNCENDENTHNHQEHQIAEIKHLDINEIPEVESAISELNNFSSKQNKSTFSKSMNTNFGSLDLSNILEYANNDGKLTYSFLIDKEISLENPYTFENLHLVKLEEGYLAYILKWEPNQDWFENNDYNFLLQYFTGKRTHYDLDYNIIQQTNFINGEPINITSNKSKASKNEHKSMDMEIICVDIIYNLCTDTGKLYCGGSICGFGSKTYCSLVYSGGGGTGGDGSNNSDPDSGNGTSRSGGGSGTRIPRNTNSDSDVVDDGDAIVVPIAPITPSRLDGEIDSFFDNLTQEQKDCLNTPFNQIRTKVTAFFKTNQTIQKFGEDGALIAPEIKNFANVAIDASCDGAEVDWEDGIIIDKTFKDTKTKCIHDKLNNGNNLYKNLLDKFDDSNTNILKLKKGTTSNGDWGITKGDLDNTREFTITISNNVENSSNLIKMVTLTHELIHAYMFDTLEDWGYLTYDIDNNPLLNITCQNGINYNNINLNTLTDDEKFVALICAINSNGTLTNNWTHLLFNTQTFNSTIYRQELENLIFNEHDWDLESQSFKDSVEDIFGNNWKRKISEAVSWIGLEGTDEYVDYLNGFSTNFQQFLYIQQIRNNVSNLNSSCL